MEDRDVLLAWDAMGYNAGITYDKRSGQLLGYAEDWDFGLCVQKYANKVNVLTVISPQRHISLNFPVAHYHVNALTSTQIYQQVMSVIKHLYHVSAARVVGVICDGASEHSKFFRIILDGCSTEDVTRLVYFRHPCDHDTKVYAISDVPHITKKGRGSLYRSGQQIWSTRRMLYGEEGDSVHDGHLITWCPMVYLHEERNKKNSAGQERRE